MRRVIALILAVATLAIAVSCSSGSGSQVSGAKSDALKSGNSKELTMYIMDYDTTVKKAIEKFNDTHKDVQIKAKSLVAIPADNLSSKLMYELNSGEGPDLILCEQNTLPNLSVFFNKGSFYDLNSLINNDKCFKKTDYFEKVFEYGIFKGKRYVIPLSFKIDSLYTTEGILNKSGQGISNKGTGIENFIKGSEEYIKSISDNSPSSGNDKYYVSDISFSNLLQTTPKPFFDLANKTARFNSKEFGDLLDKYKTLSQTTCPDIMAASPAKNNSLLSDEKFIFSSVQAMGPRYAAEPYSSFKSEAEPVILPAPYADAAIHIIAKPEKYIGINSKCKNVEAAYDFIKLMLSKEFQDTDIMEGIPVNRKAYEQEKEMCLKGIKGYDFWKKGGCQKADTLKRIYSQIDKLIEGIDRCWTTDDYILDIVKTEADKYINKSSSKEDTLKAIQEKVEGYLKSGIMIESPDKAADEIPVDPSKTVTLYYWSSSECYVTNSIDEYNEDSQDIKIKKKTFDDYEEFYKTTAVELMAGAGPDVIIFQPRFFNSMIKAVKSGAFCIMDDYIKKYNILDMNEYNRGMLDGGVYDGKRYYIPLYYYYFPMLTTTKWLDNNNIVIKDGEWTWEKFVEYSKEFRRKNNGKYFVNGLDFKMMLTNADISFIDYVNKKSNFNSTEFKSLLKLYKELYPSIELNKYELGQMLKNKDNVFFIMRAMGEATNSKILFSEVNDKNKENIISVPMPTIGGGLKVSAIPSDSIGVNAKCKNKEAAFKFIKIAASYDMQRDYDKRGKVNAIVCTPVNNKAYVDDMLSYQTSNSLPKSFVDSIIRNHELLEDCSIKDYNTITVINDLVKDYIDGKKTEDQVVKEIDDKVNVFLNE